MPSLKDYYAQHQLDWDVVAEQRAPHRFIRLNPRFNLSETKHQLEVCCFLLLTCSLCPSFFSAVLHPCR